MSRSILICPGRGSYTEASLRKLPADDPWVRRAEELRSEMDADLEPLGSHSTQATVSSLHATFALPTSPP